MRKKIKSCESDNKENEPELECLYCDRKFNVRTILIHLKLRIFLTISKILFTLKLYQNCYLENIQLNQTFESSAFYLNGCI